MFSFLTGLFIIGSVGFWILVAVVSILMFYFLEYDKSFRASLTLIITILFLFWFGNLSFSYISANPLQFLAFVAGYFVAGAVWTVVKWWFFVYRMREEYNEIRESFLRSENVGGPGIPDDLKSNWYGYLRRNVNYGKYGSRSRLKLIANGVEPPKPNDFKSRIYSWMVFWPWSMVYTLIDDPVRKIFRFIYRNIKYLLERISAHAFRKTWDDFNPVRDIERREDRPQDNDSD